MATSHFSRLTFGLTLFVLAPISVAACGHAAAVPPLAVPERLSQDGESIYFGKVFAQGEAKLQPVFVYERRVASRGSGVVSSHVTRSPQGSIALAEEALHDGQYALSRYELFTNQRGQRGSITRRGNAVHFRLVEGGREQTAAEHQPDLPVLVGPTLVGYVVQHLPALRSGQRLGVRLAVLDRLETLGFELEAVPAPSGETHVRMRPSALLVRLAVNPVLFTFESATGKLLRLEGPVPTKLPTAAGLEDFDARVEYSFVSPQYR